MSNKTIVKTATERLDEITQLLSHDPKSLELIDGFKKHLDSYGDVINIEARINAAVDAKFALAMMKINGRDEFETFISFFNDATSRLRYAFNIARRAGLNEADMEFLTANAGDAFTGECDDTAVTIDLPTREEVAEIVDKSPLAPAVELWKRMEIYERVSYEPLDLPAIPKASAADIFTHLVEAEREADNLAKTLRHYDPNPEFQFQQEIAEQLRTEEARVAAYEANGTIDPNVEWNLGFLPYRDQLDYNIQLLKAKAERGSLQRAWHEERQREFENVSQRIQRLTEAHFFANEREEAEADIAKAKAESAEEAAAD